MHGHEVFVLWLRWFWTAFFALIGLYSITRIRYYLRASTADCGLRIATTADSNAAPRIEAALERRELAEGPPMPIGLWSGALCLLLAAVAATGRVQPALLYAFMCLGMAACIAAVFLRLRNCQPTRVAVLAARSANSVIPAYWFYITAICALGVLTYVTNPEYRTAAVIVAASSLLTIALAWRLTKLPALLSGVDIQAEQIVDDRLRFYRSRAAMVYATVQIFVFCSQVIGSQTTPQVVTYALSSILWVAFAVWMIRRQYVAVRLA